MSPCDVALESVKAQDYGYKCKVTGKPKSWQHVRAHVQDGLGHTNLMLTRRIIEPPRKRWPGELLDSSWIIRDTPEAGQGNGAGPRNQSRVCWLAGIWLDIDCLLGKVQIVPKPLPPDDLVDGQARVAISQWQEKVPPSSHSSQDGKCGDPNTHHTLPGEAFPSGDVTLGPSLLFGRLGRLLGLDGVNGEDELNQRARDKCRG